MADGGILAEGTPEELRAPTDPFVRQFIDGEPDGRSVPLPGAPLRRGLELGREGMISALGRWALDGFGTVGLTLARSVPASRARILSVAARGRVWSSKQIYFVGNCSLVIIAVSGLFVGIVLGLQGYDTLQRYGSESLGLLVALSLVRELGPVVTALLFAGRAGTSLTAEIGLMKAERAAHRDGNDGGRSDRARRRAALLGRGDRHAAARRDFSARSASSAAISSAC